MPSLACVILGLLGACAAPAAQCGALPTRALAAEAVVRELSIRGGSREVAGQRDVLIGARGDTVRLLGGNDGVVLAWHKDGGMAVATLHNVRATGGDRRGWQCQAEVLVVDVSVGAQPPQLPPIPISYTSVGANARHVVKVRIRSDQVTR